MFSNFVFLSHVCIYIQRFEGFSSLLGNKLGESNIYIMACSTPIITKDFFMKTDQELYGEDENKNSSGFEKVARTPDDQQGDISLRSMDEENNMSQSVRFFRKYLLTRSQNNVAKTSMEAEFESEIIKRHSPPCPVLPPKFLGSKNFPGHRLSLLERQLLPGLR